jgi:hypothetical protein
MGAPAAAMRVPKVWRRSWKRTGRRPARFAAFLKRFCSFDGSRTVPSDGCAKTRSSSAEGSAIETGVLFVRELLKLVPDPGVPLLGRAFR